MLDELSYSRSLYKLRAAPITLQIYNYAPNYTYRYSRTSNPPRCRTLIITEPHLVPHLVN